MSVTNLDGVVRIIRGSSTPADARASLIAREWPVAEIASYIALVEAVEPEVHGDSYRLSETQVRSILELRLHRLTAPGRDEIAGELRELAARSEAHTSELQSLKRISYAVFCLKKK